MPLSYRREKQVQIDLRMANDVRGPEILYAFEHLLAAVGLPKAAGEDLSERRLVVFYGNHAKAGDADLVIPAVQDWEHVQDIRLDEAGLEVFTPFPPVPGESGRLAARCDLLTTAFFFLSGMQEAQGKRDQYGRFPYEGSLSARWDLALDPPVARCASALFAYIEKAAKRRGWALESLPLWPEERPFALALTHDIDELEVPGIKGLIADIREAAALLLRKRRPVEAWHQLWQTLLRPTSIGRSRTVEDLLRVEQEHGVAAAYFFILSQDHHRDARYRFSSPHAPALVKRLERVGAEIGIHGSFFSGDEPERLVGEWGELTARCEARGGRQHFLRIDPTRHFPIYESLGMEYDSSLGFAEVPGWRHGCPFPFYPWSAAQRRPFTVLQLPLTLMDATLKLYQRCSAEEAVAAAGRVLRRTEEVGGLCTLLWHNSYMNPAYGAGYPPLYSKIIEMARSRGAWIVPPSTLAAWWRERWRILIGSEVPR